MVDTVVKDSPSGRIVRRTTIVAVDVESLAAATAVDTALTVAGSLVGDAAVCTPLGTWPAGLTWPGGRCLVAGTVQMRVGNVTAGAIDPGSQNVRVDLLRG